MTASRYRLALGVGVAAFLGLIGATALLITHESDTTQAPAAVVEGPPSPFEGSLMPEGVRAPDFALRDELGRPIRMRDLRGEPVVVTFLYSTCTESCPGEAQLVRGALDDLEHDVPALSVSVDPFRDTPASARQFNNRQHVSGQLRWVLGKRRELRPVWQGFAIQPQLREREHQVRITLVDAKGFQRVGWPGGQATPELIAHDLRVLDREAHRD